MLLLLVRHGETRFNQEHRYLGALDPELSPDGFAQAEALRKLLSGAIDAVLCSPLLRARQTAKVICMGTEIEPVEMHWLRERNVGVFEGLTRAEAMARFPDLWSQNITRQWEAAPPGGETIQQVVLRVSQGLASLQGADLGSRLALVCHGFVAKVIRALCGVGFEDFWKSGLTGPSTRTHKCVRARCARASCAPVKSNVSPHSHPCPHPASLAVRCSPLRRSPRFAIVP